MKHFIATSIFVFFTVGVLRGQDASKTEDADQSKAPNYVSVDKISTGENVLLVKYPWSVHDKASIEVRLITEKKDLRANIRPLRFSMIRFDDNIQRRIYRTFDDSLNQPSDWKTETGGQNWQIIGHGNHLNRQAEWFVNTPKEKAAILGITAAFYPLDPWAEGDRLLMLDLPRDSFDQPGTMYVWFLRGDKILWREELDWPGQNAMKAE
jgi:hypothetical protein